MHDDQSSVALRNSGAEHDQVLAPVAEAIRGSRNVTLRNGHHVSQMPLCSALSMLSACASTARTSRGLRALTAPARSG